LTSTPLNTNFPPEMSPKPRTSFSAKSPPPPKPPKPEKFKGTEIQRAKSLDASSVDLLSHNKKKE